jgi:anthranilate synthase component 2
VRILLIDNRDSFTFNLADACRTAGAEVSVVRNSIAAEEALAVAEQTGAILMLSPGPGTPRDAGCSLELARIARGKVPLLGVCLGHQAMVEAAGGRVIRAAVPHHGKSSMMAHDGAAFMAGSPSPMLVGRYHSLCTPNPPACFHVHAEIDGMAMAISDAEGGQAALQFHPESILTPRGQELLVAMLAWTDEWMVSRAGFEPATY